jgi:hypothetical protein
MYLKILQTQIDYLEKEVKIIKEACLELCKELLKLKKHNRNLLLELQDFPISLDDKSSSDDEDY